MKLSGTFEGIFVSLRFSCMTLLWLSFLMFSATVVPQVIEFRIATITQLVLLDCPGSSESHLNWKFKNEVIYLNRIPFNGDREEKFNLSANYALNVASVSLAHEGVYECVRDSKSCVKYFLEVQVSPKLFLLYDNVILSNASYQKDNGYETFSRERRYVAEGRAINVTCLAEGAKPEANITWTIDGEKFDNIPQETERNLQENRTFDSISTLQFSPTGESTTLTCNVSLDGTDIAASTSATFHTYVPPNVFFLINDNRVHSDKIYVTKDEIVNITCYAEGSRPLANLTWEENYIHLESFSEETKNTNNTTFDTSLTLTLSLQREVEKIACRTTIEEINVTEAVCLEIKTFVLQEPSITFNGIESDTIYFEPTTEVNLTCHAFDSLPKPKLIWKINGKFAEDTISRISQSSSSVTLSFLPKHNDLVECVSYIDGPNITRVVNVTLSANDAGNLTSSFDYITKLGVPIIGTVIFIALILLLCVYFATKKIRGSSSFSTDLGITLKETASAKNQVNPQKDYIEEANTTYPKPPDLELPNIPSGSDKPFYADLPEQENAYDVKLHSEDYYSAMGDSDAKGKMFCEKDICFVINMKKGHIYNRWMGTIDTNFEEKKCVVLSTVSDNVRKKEIHWDKFVKQILELPEATNLTKVEGIGINEGKMYLIHEHMACEKLDVRIADPGSETELMGYVCGILEGLDVIHSFGLLHPALSTKKVLLTKQGICKLYDFCLTEDVSNIVKIRKSRMICTLNQLAPEAILRDKYSKASDIWSVAVVIWEILSRGSPPFPHEEQSPDSENAVYNIPETWPTKYKISSNKLLFECWNQETSLRPTICQLKSSFTECFESLDTYGPSVTSTEDSAASYVHMEGIGKS